MAMRMRRRRYPVRRRYVRKNYRRRAYGRRPYTSLITGTSAATSRPGSANYRRKRVSRRTIKRRRIAASDAALHHRSTNTTVAAFNTAVSVGTSAVHFMFLVPDNVVSGTTRGGFWTTVGGLIPRHGDSTATDFGNGDLFIRGGKSTLVVTNLSAQPGFAAGAPILVRTWRGRTKTRPSSPLFPQLGVGATTAAVRGGWDPSIPTQSGSTIDDDPYRQFSFWDMKTIHLESGQSFERIAFIRSQKVSPDTWWNDNGFRDFWIIMVQTLVNGSAAPYQWQVTDNLSFSGDRVI